MAAERQPRHNAGNRMAKLLNEEEEDDFYKNTYGGFNDVCFKNFYDYCFLLNVFDRNS